MSDSPLPNSKYQIAIQRSDGNTFDIGSQDVKLKNVNPTDFSVLRKWLIQLKNGLNNMGIYIFHHIAKEIYIKRSYQNISKLKVRMGWGCF